MSDLSTIAQDESVQPEIPVAEPANVPAPGEPDDPKPENTEEASEPKERRPRGWLAASVKAVCDRFITGELTLPEGKHLTPHTVAREVQKLDGLDKPPSVGAVSAVFKRWDEYGFAEFGQKPFAFRDYTDKGRERGLQGIIADRRTVRKEATAARKAATKAEKTEAADPAPVDPVLDDSPTGF